MLKVLLRLSTVSKMFKAFKCGVPDQEGYEQQDGHRCRHVDNLPRGLDRLEYAEVDDDPRNNEEDEELPADAAHVGDGLGHPKYSLTTTGRDSHRRVSQLLLHHPYGLLVILLRTRLQRRVSGRILTHVKAFWRVPLIFTANPGKRVLERRYHVEQRPRDDDVVVRAQPERYHDGREASTLKRIVVRLELTHGNTDAQLFIQQLSPSWFPFSERE